jgi:hypothetical protein
MLHDVINAPMIRCGMNLKARDTHISCILEFMFSHVRKVLRSQKVQQYHSDVHYSEMHGTHIGFSTWVGLRVKMSFQHLCLFKCY